jgi:hypothetical protein
MAIGAIANRALTRRAPGGWYRATVAMGATGQGACLDAPMLHRRSSSFGVGELSLASRDRTGRDGRKAARSEEERRSAGLQAANCRAGDGGGATLIKKERDRTNQEATPLR